MDLYRRAKELRRKATKAEKILWNHLSNRKLNNYKFRSQAVVENLYIADFYCASKKLIIEVDGGVHSEIEVKEKDIIRTAVLNSCDYNVIRFKNEEVLFGIEGVILEIRRVLGKI